MKNILLTVSYDGTDYCGWQFQPDLPTIQGELERAVSKMLKQPTAVVGSGRTDSGVHATGQAVNFTSPIDTIPMDGYVRALNGLLPPAIRIVQAKEVAPNISARFSATSRTYRYFIADFPVSAVASRFVWSVRKSNNFNIDALNKECVSLLGETDCKTFCAAGDASLSTSRFINNAHFFRDTAFFCDNVLIFEITANAFLYRMVRSIVGTLVELSSKGCIQQFHEILSSKDRRRALVTAPPNGLFLWQVGFDGERKH